MKTTTQTIQEIKENLTIGQLKAIALLKYQDADLSTIDINDVEPIEEDEERYGYMVLSDEEADDRVSENIKNSLWAFNASFIFGFLNIYDYSGQSEKAFQKMQGEMCESANPIIEAMIGDKIEDFIIEAVNADGRGHFMYSYDGDENEETVNGQTFYIYRMN